MAAPDVTYDTITQYVDWGGHTVTVDPVRRERWIHEGADDLHRQTAERGRDKDRRDVTSLLPLLNGAPARVATYMPSTSDLMHMPVYPKKPKASMLDHGVVAPFDEIYSYRSGIIKDKRMGQYPVIEQMHRDGILKEGASKDDIVRQTLANSKIIERRIHQR